MHECTSAPVPEETSHTACGTNPVQLVACMQFIYAIHYTCHLYIHKHKRVPTAQACYVTLCCRKGCLGQINDASPPSAVMK